MVDNSKMTYQQRLDYLTHCTPAQWDALCRRCGVCCLCKVDAAGITPSGVVFTTLACQHLNIKTRTCRVYRDRIALCHGDCLPVDLNIVVNTRLLPDSCGYVEFLYGPAKNRAVLDWAQVRNAAPNEDEDPTAMLPRILWNSGKWIVR